jgi:hypothetical protein
MDHKDYVKAAEEHLKETIVNAEGNEKPLYTKVNDNLFNEAKNKLQALLMSGFDNDIISKQELEAMCPESKTMSKFYCNFKVHKKYEHIPPVRPIISGSGSLLENPSKFVDYHIKELATKHDTYLQDTPDFLRKVEELNSKGSLPDNALLVTIDVKGLFTNIPQEEGTQATEEALNERDVQTVPSEFIVAMLRIILKNNIFTFNEDVYLQEEGSGMGQKHTPHYADIFMGRKIDPFIKIISQKYEEGTFTFMKRLLDDIFKIFCGTSKNLHLLFDEMNRLHPSIKFTMTHTYNIKESSDTRCSCEPLESIPFLDTKCQIKNGKVIFDLYKKPTDRNMYLLPSSCHPPQHHQNVPYGLAMRINRICSVPEERDTRFEELQDWLGNRGYRSGMVSAAISKARNIPRHIGLQKVVKPSHQKRPISVVSWDPRLPNIDATQQKNYRAMTFPDPYLKEVYPEVPLVAYGRPTNIREYLIRAKLPPKNRSNPSRQLKGMTKRKNTCLTFSYILEVKNVKQNTLCGT